MMINRIETRKDIDKEISHLKESYTDDLRRLKKRIISKKSFNLNAYKRTGLDLAIFKVMSKEESNLLEPLISYIEFGVRHFQREFCIESILKIKLAGEELEIESTNERSGTSIFDWWKLFNMALILRNDEFKNDLYNLLDNCMNESKDPFWRRSMDLILMCNEKKEFQESILSDLKGIVNSGVVEFHGIDGNKLIKSKEGKDIRETMWLPIMELYYLAYNNKENAFNKLLEEYLISKKQWIIDNKEEDNSNYWIDFPLLACCSYAHDRNLKITIESDYIPSFIYKGEISS